MTAPAPAADATGAAGGAVAIAGDAAPTRPLRVAALIDTAETSGPGRQLAALAGALADRGVEMLVVLLHHRGRPYPPYAEYLERLGVPHRVLPDRGRVDVRVVGLLRALLADWGPDVVQTHSYKTTALAYALRRTGARWPWVAFFHGATNEDAKVRLYHWLDRQLTKRADRVVVMSRAHALGYGSLGDRVRVVHNAVIPLPAETESWSTAASGASDVRPRLGVVGRLSREKGVDVFLDACAMLRERGVTFSAVVAGDGPERQALAEQCERLKLGDTVRFLGPVRAVESLYKEIDLLVIPSRSEGLPNVLLEALRADVPAVATRVGAVPEVIQSDDAGLIVSPEDPAALADAIVRALPMKASAECAAARRETMERFSLAHRADEHVKLYRSLVADRRRGGAR